MFFLGGGGRVNNFLWNKTLENVSISHGTLDPIEKNLYESQKYMFDDKHYNRRDDTLF